MTTKVRVKFKESDHPRVPAGNRDGGQFAVKGQRVVVRLKYSPSQPRDEDGRWTSGGGGSGIGDVVTTQQFDNFKIHSAQPGTKFPEDTLYPKSGERPVIITKNGVVHIGEYPAIHTDMIRELGYGVRDFDDIARMTVFRGGKKKTLG